MKTSTKTAATIVKPASKPAAKKPAAPPPIAPGAPPIIGTLMLVESDHIHISEHNTRQPTLKEVTAEGLVDSMRAQGQITPGIGRPHPKWGKGHIELAAGARRSVAAKALGIAYKVVVRPMTDVELLDVILTENLQRTDPDPEQEAMLIQMRMDEGIRPAEICARYGKPELWIKRRMKLLSIIPAIRKRMLPGGDLAHFTTGMKERIGALAKDKQEAHNKQPYTLSNNTTLDELISELTTQTEDLEGATWLHDPATFIPGCGPGCITDTKASLFPEDGGKCGSCLNPECFNKREALAIDKAITNCIKGHALSDIVLFRSDGHSPVMFEGKKLNALQPWDFRQHYEVLTTHAGLYALDVGNPLKPKLISVKRKAESKGKTEPGKAAPGESRESKLTGRRMAAMNTRLVEALEKAPLPASPPILHLVAAFGTVSNHNNCLSKSDHTEPWDSLTANSTAKVPGLSHCAKPATREEVLWHSIRPILRMRLQFQTNKDLVNSHKSLEMAALAKLISFPWEKILTGICTTECPVPKSWGPGIDPFTLIQVKPAKAAKK